MGFIALCERRLEDLELRRTHHYFYETRKLFEKLVVLWGAEKRITRDIVIGYLNGIAKKTPHTANKELRNIKSLFNFGIKRGWITENPANGIDNFPVSNKPRYIPPLEDLLKVLAIAKPIDRAYLVIVWHTLARIREVNRLKWEDVFGDYLILRTRKSKNSDLKERKIPLTRTAKQVLDELPRLGEYVFPNPRTKTLYDYRKKFLGTLCRKAGVRVFTFHCLRHLGASTLDKEGVALTDIQKILGHERATTTDIYLRSIGNLQEAIDKLDKPQGKEVTP
jgi:integrase